MTPTVEVDATSSPLSGLDCGGQLQHFSQSETNRTSMEMVTNSHVLDNRCPVCHCSQEATTTQRPTIPDASPAFREAMVKMKSERAQTATTHSVNANLDNAKLIISASSSSPPTSPPTSPPSSPHSISSPTSLFNKLRSAFKSTSSNSSQNSPSISGRKKLAASGSNKAGSSRRPASFGGADVIKPWTGRRCSQSEKRVSWADELGSNHALISVRFIKPRLAAPSKSGRQTTPGHSILRNTGLH